MTKPTNTTGGMSAGEGKHALPDILPGHWTTADGLDKAREYAVKARGDLALSQHTDLAIANALYLVNGEIVIQTAAKERMRWLSVQLAIANALTADLLEALARNRKALDLIDPDRPLQYAHTMDLMRQDMDAAIAKASQ